MSNEGDKASSVFAKRLSDAMAANGLIPQRDNRANDGYIGELNTVKKENRISILGEFGYFNKAEIVKICSDEYVEYVSDKISESIYQQLKTIDGKETQPASVKTELPTEEVMKVEEPKQVVVKVGEAKESFDYSQLEKNLNELDKAMDDIEKSLSEIEDISVKVSENVVTVGTVKIEQPADVVVLSFK